MLCPEGVILLIFIHVVKNDPLKKKSPLRTAGLQDLFVSVLLLFVFCFRSDLVL